MKRELDNCYSSVFKAIQERPWGYFTDIPGALGDSIIVPVSIINLPDTFATLNLSKFLGAGPAIVVALSLKKGNLNGHIQFINGTPQFLSNAVMSARPEVGDFYIFPSYLFHGVHPFYTKGERRSFSMNMIFNMV